MESKIKKIYKIINFKSFDTKNSNLVALQKDSNCPFEIKRVFYIFGVSENVVRGKHANKNSQFLLIALSGSCKIKVRYFQSEEIFCLDSPKKGLFLGKMLWKEMFDFSKDCILLVLSDCYYDKDEYIYDLTTLSGGGDYSYLNTSLVA